MPLGIVVLYAFNASRGQTWPITAWTLRWWSVAWGNGDVLQSLRVSLEAGVGATATALVLGSCAAAAVHRFRFFGRETVSLLLVLAIALPGILTGIALSAGINVGHQLFGLDFGLATVIIGHATFCVVVVYNNVIARLRRTSGSLVEASQDLGADGWQTLRWVVWPNIRGAVVAGALLAFALSFDEVVVTLFTAGTLQTLPLWVFNNLRLPNQRPQVNVVAVAVLALSVLPVLLTQRLTRDTETQAGGRV